MQEEPDDDMNLVSSQQMAHVYVHCMCIVYVYVYVYM